MIEDKKEGFLCSEYWQRGYRVGIDDYMVKPVDLEEMFLRIGVLLRRAKIASSRKLTVGSFSMDADEHTAYLGEDEINLTMREFNILYKLLSYPKKTFTRTQLMDEFWDADTAPFAGRKTERICRGYCCILTQIGRLDFQYTETEQA